MLTGKVHIILAVVLLPVFFCSLVYPAGNYSPRIAEPITEIWRWQNFPELNSKGAQCIAETKNKLLYFGVNGGVIRYDGLNWKFFSFGEGMAEIPVVALCVASDQTIYAGTSKGIWQYKSGSWNKINLNLDFGDPFDFPYNKFPVIETSDGSIWAGSQKGLLRLKDGKFNLYAERLFLKDIRNKQAALKKLPAFDIFTIYEDKSGMLWFGLRDGRIYKCPLPNDMKSGLFMQPVFKEKGYVQAKFPLISMDSSGKIFIISGAKDGGMNIYEKNKWVPFSIRKRFNIDDLQNDILRLNDGSICVSGIGRLFFCKDNQWSMYERNRLPFPSNRLRLFQSSDNYLWIIGLSNDVVRIDLSYKKWITYRNLNFQAEDKNGCQWFITVEGEVVKYDRSTGRWISYNEKDGLISTPITLFITPKGEIWAAGSHNNIAATSFFDGKVWHKQVHPSISWGIDRRAILYAKDESLWFGTSSDFEGSRGEKGGIVKYARSAEGKDVNFNFTYFPSSSKFRLYGVYGIGQTPDEDIWVGQLGFYRLRYKEGRWEKITSPIGLSQNFVDCISSSPTGDLWVGTRTNGLFCLNRKSKKWIQFTTKSGLISNSILDIACDKKGNVWVVTDRDVSHFDGVNWTTDVLPNMFKFMRDGINIKYTSGGSIWVNQNPSLWYRRSLYTDKYAGYSENFSSTRYHPDNLYPQTKITFSLDVIQQPGNVILSWDGNDPWKLTPTDKIQYSYRFDNGAWSAFSSKKSEIFLSLESGNHIFEVKARNRDMNVDPTPAKISFYVEPPLWMEPWFVFLILSFFATLSSFIIHLYHRNKIIQDLSETRARLFTNISHELRTPLTLILGSLSKIISLTEENKKIKEPLGLMQRNSRRLLRLINQILDYRKIEAGQMQFEPCHGDIVEFIHDEYFSFTHEAEDKNIDLKFTSCVEHLETWFDPDKIEKIIFNLLSNALKFTPPGKAVTVGINISSGEENTFSLKQNFNFSFNKYIIISVKDSGIGISEENINKIFDRFYQVHDPSASIAGGTGIGLSVVKEMTKIHLGSINVQSTRGEGTTFNVTIPVLEQEMIPGIVYKDTINNNAAGNSLIAPKLNIPVKKGCSKVLIIEDNSDMRLYIAGELACEYEILEAVDGVDGFEKAVSFGPDLVISDIMMPRMDGIELCRKIKLDERTSHIPVILLTARSSKENMLEGLETGADDYLGKPFNSEELKLRIRNIIEARNRIRERFGNSLKVEPKAIAVTSVDKKLIEKAIDIIEQHMDDSDFSVETFSSLIGMNRVSLYHKIKSLTNLSPREFFTTIRLKRAAQLLKESGLTVTEIAFKVGFKDSSHFSKLFKKQFGKTPKEYMKEIQS